MTTTLPSPPSQEPTTFHCAVSAQNIKFNAHFAGWLCVFWYRHRPSPSRGQTDGNDVSIDLVMLIWWTGTLTWGQLGADGIGKRGRLRFHHGTAGSRRRGRGAAVEGVADGSAAAGGAGRTPKGVAPPALGRPLIETLPVERTFQCCTGHFVILLIAAAA